MVTANTTILISKASLVFPIPIMLLMAIKSNNLIAHKSYRPNINSHLHFQATNYPVKSKFIQEPVSQCALRLHLETLARKIITLQLPKNHQSASGNQSQILSRQEVVMGLPTQKKTEEIKRNKKYWINFKNQREFKNSMRKN